MPTTKRSGPRSSHHASTPQLRRILSESLTVALCEALERDHISSDFQTAVARALARYRITRGAPRIAQQQREAVQRVLMSVRALQLATRRADAALKPSRRLAAQTWTDFIPIAWGDLALPLSELRERLEAWLIAQITPRRARGAPHDGRFHLRIAIFQALLREEVSITTNGQNGSAARVLRVVLREADRLDGKPTRDRATFNGTQWKTWVTQHRQADELLRSFEATGFRRTDMIEHLNLIPPAL